MPEAFHTTEAVKPSARSFPPRMGADVSDGPEGSAQRQERENARKAPTQKRPQRWDTLPSLPQRGRVAPQRQERENAAILPTQKRPQL